MASEISASAAPSGSKHEQSHANRSIGSEACRRWRFVGAWLVSVTALALGCSGSVDPDVSDDGDVPVPTAVPPRQAGPAGDVTTPAAQTGPSALARRVAAASAGRDLARGGRLYDNFYTENSALDFRPDDASTQGLADGEGGPLGNGTLRDGTGAVLGNDLGHGYRLKNLFGWDMRGQDGVYGPEYQDKAYVMDINLIEDATSREAVARLIVDGAPGVPAYGDIMPEEDLADLVAFVMAVREHDLPQPSDIWELASEAPSGYVLARGADPVAGSAIIASSCAGCHGADGTGILFDDGEFSLGTLSRASAYEVWFKIIAGNPGTPMRSQVPVGEPAAVQAQVVLDVLAALCDRSAFPRGGASEPDVQSGDPRCGAYLR